MVLGEVVEARELRESREAENALEERRRHVADRATLLVAAGLCDEQKPAAQIRDLFCERTGPDLELHDLRP